MCCLTDYTQWAIDAVVPHLPQERREEFLVRVAVLRKASQLGNERRWPQLNERFLAVREGIRSFEKKFESCLVEEDGCVRLAELEMALEGYLEHVFDALDYSLADDNLEEVLLV